MLKLRAVADQLSVAEHAVAEAPTLVPPTAAAELRGFQQELGRAMDSLGRISGLLTAWREQIDACSLSDKPDTIGETFLRLVAEGHLIDSAELQRRAGVTRQAVSKAVAARRLFYLEHGGQRGYPAFFLDPELERTQVEAVSKQLGDLSGGSKFMFFTTARGSLATAGEIRRGVMTESGVPRTPLQALKDGDFERVRMAAEAFSGC
ncbi:hypothetical protein ACG04Q_19250 [Roseateles sp. DXS20W]|uniref:MarR family transcriptional regulator n=1 Tax=Pelomonas lactea TaxID=3299030 RepID=A0ABW7GPH3_9BURK